MKIKFSNVLLIGFILSLCIFSCKQTAQPYGDAVMSPEFILENQTNFSNYWYQKLRLSDDFIALDTASNNISKEEFLKQVSTGKFLPLLLNSDTPYYKLYKINTAIDDWIATSLKGIGNNEYAQFLWEGKLIPEFDFTDLTGSNYNNETTRGKLLVINFWFIGCAPCVAEMPDLNKLVKVYENRNDIIFISIAPNNEKQLKEFFSRTRFDYKNVSDTISQMVNTIRVPSFPTHMVVNKEGKIVKIIAGYRNDQLQQLEATIKKQLL